MEMKTPDAMLTTMQSIQCIPHFSSPSLTNFFLVPQRASER